MEAEVNVGLFLHVNIDGTKINANYTLSIGSSFNRKFEYTFDKLNSSWGRAKICSRDDFFDPDNEFLVDGKVKIELEGIFKAVDLKRKATTEVCTLGEMLFEREDKDYIIAVDDEEIMVTFVFDSHLHFSSLGS